MIESTHFDLPDSSYVGQDTSGPFVDFNDWFAGIVEEVKPSCIVGIARGAVRLLQLQNVQDTLGSIPILSDYALPFLPDSDIRGRRILLFDDSVIFGSTLCQLRQYLLSRGAVVFCAAYIVDRVNFYGEQEPETLVSITPSVHRDIPLRAKHLLWPSDIRRHHNRLIDSILGTTRDYNLDFPKFRLTIPEYSATDIPYLVRLLEDADGFESIHDVSSPMSAANGVYRYTALLEPRLSGVLTGGNLSFRPYSKARMIFIPEIHEIHVTAMPQVSLTNGSLLQRIEFEDSALQSLWKGLSPPLIREDEFYPKAIFRLLTFFIGTILGESVVRELIAVLRPDFHVSHSTLVNDDIVPAVGVGNSFVLREIWSQLRNAQSILGLAMDRSGAVVDSREYINETLLIAIKEEWRKRPWLKPRSGELVHEILGKVLLTLRSVTDSPECRENNPGSSRLDVGLTYEAIRLLLQRDCGIELAPDEISIAIDMCVDNGQAVPKVIRQSGVWLRAFYSGEAEDAHPTFQFKDAFHRGYSDLLDQNRVRPLTEFDVHKLCSTLKALFRWLPISTRPHTFGRYTMVGNNQQELIGWLVNHGSGPVRPGLDLEGRKSLLVNDAYESCVEPTWKPDTSRQFFDAFQYIATAFSTIKDSGPKLLLSTCRTHRDTYNAVAIEAHNWVETDRGHFLRLLNAAKLDDVGALRNVETTLDSVYWCTRYLTEALIKHAIFHKSFERLKRQLEKTFKKQGKSAARFWKYAIVENNLLDSSIDKEIELKFSSLMPLLTQMRHLTAYLVGVLLHAGLLEEKQLKEKFENEGAIFEHRNFHWLTEDDLRRRALLYNENIKRRKVTGLSIEKTELPVTMPPNGESALAWYGESLKAVRTCFMEVSSSLFRFAPYYQTQEGEYPFAPPSDRRVLYDGNVETILRDVYVLTIEIIKSTNSIQTNQMKDVVSATFNTFAKKIHYDISGNDAFVACSVDPTVLIDIARIIMREGESLKDSGGPFGGTRKGISFGTLRYVEDYDSRPRLMDAVFPNILPDAFSMLDGIDARYAKKLDERNFAIIAQESIADQLAPLLGKKFSKQDRFMAKGKHFRGRCYCFSLVDSKE